jgi:hypothetical protein
MRQLVGQGNSKFKIQNSKFKIQNELLPNQGRINNEPSQFDIQKLSSNTNLIPNPKLRSIARSKAMRQPKTQNGDAQNQERTDGLFPEF